MQRLALGGFDEQHRPVLAFGDTGELEQGTELPVLGDLEIAVFELLGGHTLGEIRKPMGIGEGRRSISNIQRRRIHASRRGVRGAGGEGHGAHFHMSDPPFSFVITSSELVIQTPTLPGKSLHERGSPTTPPQCDSALAESTASSGGHKLYPLAVRPPPGVIGRTAAAAFMMAPMKPRAVLPRRPERSPEPSEPSLFPPSVAAPGGGAIWPLAELGVALLLPDSDGGRGDVTRSREGGGMGRPSL